MMEERVEPTNKSQEVSQDTSFTVEGPFTLDFHINQLIYSMGSDFDAPHTTRNLVYKPSFGRQIPINYEFKPKRPTSSTI